MVFKWFEDLFAAPPTRYDRPLRDFSRFDIGVCPGCRQIRSVASLRCTTCGSAAPVTADA